MAEASAAVAAVGCRRRLRRHIADGAAVAGERPSMRSAVGDKSLLAAVVDVAADSRN